MKNLWVAVVCVLALTGLAFGMVVFSTGGSGWLAEQLSQAAKTADPDWQQRLYRWSLSLNPYDPAPRLALAELYREQGLEEASEALLREGTLYASGPDVHLALAAIYTGQGRLADACALLDLPQGSRLARRLTGLRPEAPSLPESGRYPEGHPFYLTGQGALWLQIDGGEWVPYDQPVRLPPGQHTLRGLALDSRGIPSAPVQRRYTVEAAQTAHLPARPDPAPQEPNSVPQAR